jgi:moderate conductance mechanosensitive channel
LLPLLRNTLLIGLALVAVIAAAGDPRSSVSEELLDDSEIGAEFMQPLKMQGVVDVLHKFTATPSRPTYLQRQALRRLIDAFAAGEIRFAAPNVTVQLTSAAAG